MTTSASRLRACILLAGLSALGGCGDYTVSVAETDPTLRYELLLLDAAECPSASNLAATPVRERYVLSGGSADVGSLSRDGVVAAVVGRDDMCEIRVFGCAELSPSPGKTDTITPMNVAGAGACDADEVCAAGACIGGDGGVLDGGVLDGGQDTSDGNTPDTPDAAAPPLCEAISANRSCTDDAECAAPFATCDGDTCVTAVTCTERDVTLPAGVSVLDVAIGHQPAGVEALYVVDTTLGLFGALVDFRMSGPVLPADLNRENSFPGENPSSVVMRGLERIGVFEMAVQLLAPGDYSATPFITSTGGLPNMADTPDYGRLSAVTITGSDNAESIVYSANGYTDVMPGRSGDPIVISQWAEDPTNGVHADLNPDSIAETVPSTGDWVALHLDDGRISAWDAGREFPPMERAPQPTGLESEIPPGWAMNGVSQFSVVTVDASATTIHELRCPGACAASNSMEVIPEAPEQIQLFETATEGHVLVVRIAGRIDVLFLSEEGAPLIGRVTLSDPSSYVLTDFDAKLRGGVLVINAMDDGGDAHLYEVAAP